MLERSGVDMVDLGPTLAPRLQQTGRLEDVEVLRDGLSRQADLMTRREPGADLEQRLPVALAQLVEDRPPRGIGERGEGCAELVDGHCAKPIGLIRIRDDPDNNERERERRCAGSSIRPRPIMFGSGGQLFDGRTVELGESHAYGSGVVPLPHRPIGR